MLLLLFLCLALYENTPEASACELRLVPAVDLANMIALDVADGVDRHVARKGHSEVIAQAQQLTTLRANMKGGWGHAYVCVVNDRIMTKKGWHWVLGRSQWCRILLNALRCQCLTTLRKTSKLLSTGSGGHPATCQAGLGEARALGHTVTLLTVGQLRASACSIKHYMMPDFQAAAQRLP